MRLLLFLLLGVLLLALSGASNRVLHLEWLHADPILLLDVFIALTISTVDGGILVFVLGLFADSFAGTPTGMLASAHLVIWVVVRWIRQFLIPDRSVIWFGMVFVMSLVFNLLVIVQLLVMDAPGGLIWLSLKALFPVGLVHLALAAPVWLVARWIGGRALPAHPAG